MHEVPQQLRVESEGCHEGSPFQTGQPKQKWTIEEEQALRLGVEGYGVGKWRLIQKDDICGPVLANRSNVDLKDKWRNLNMEAQEQARARTQPDEDPDFQREVSERKRKKQKSTLKPPCSPHQSFQATKAASAQPSQTQDMQHAAIAASEEDTDAVPLERTLCPNHSALNCTLSGLQGSLDALLSGKGGPMIDDMIVAAVISLQHPMGSGADEICAWIEAHYPAVDRAVINQVMTHMVQAGRLQYVPCHPSLVRMGGTVRHGLIQSKFTSGVSGAADSGKGSAKLISAKLVADYALLAAQAVADAEEATERADSLMEAAASLESMDHQVLDSMDRLGGS